MMLGTDTTPTVSSKNKMLLVFSFFGLAAITLSSLFIFNLIDLPSSQRSGPNLIKNPGFEKWKHNLPLSWTVSKNCKLVKEKKGSMEGKYAISVKTGEGITQTIRLDSLEIYSLSYNVRHEVDDKSQPCVEISFKGADVRTTTDAAPGFHLHKGGTKWRNYFGRITGAKEMTIRFFSSDEHATFVDGIRLGKNVVPVDMNTDVHEASTR